MKEKQEKSLNESENFFSQKCYEELATCRQSKCHHEYF
jgi:hypothetical protein